MVPKVKSHVPVREALVAGAVSAPDAPVNWLVTADGITTVAVGVGEGGAEVGVAGAGAGEGEGGKAVGARVGVSGVSGVSVTFGRGTMVGVDEAAAAPLKATPQPLSRISRINNRPISVVFLIIGTPVSNIGQSC